MKRTSYTIEKFVFAPDLRPLVLRRPHSFSGRLEGRPLGTVLARCGITAPLLTFLALVLPPPAEAAQPTSAEVIAVRRAALPANPDDPAWRQAPVYTAALILQDMVEPRLLQPGTDKVNVRAITDGTQVAFQLEWVDTTKDDLPGLGKYSDGCAVQLPASTQPDVPAPQMGEIGRPVEITYWRAFWQGAVDGREDSIKALYPNASVDHYPFEAASLEPGSEAQQAMAKRYAPARALNNPMAGPRPRPVEDLIADGPGSVRPAEKTQSNGRGNWTPQKWTVVLSRPVPKGVEPGSRTQVAFAVWQGSHLESGARKMRSVWIPLLIEKGK